MVGNKNTWWDSWAAVYCLVTKRDVIHCINGHMSETWTLWYSSGVINWGVAVSRRSKDMPQHWVFVNAWDKQANLASVAVWQELVLPLTITCEDPVRAEPVRSTDRWDETLTDNTQRANTETGHLTHLCLQRRSAYVNQKIKCTIQPRVSQRSPRRGSSQRLDIKLVCLTLKLKPKPRLYMFPNSPKRRSNSVGSLVTWN